MCESSVWLCECIRMLNVLLKQKQTLNARKTINVVVGFIPVSCAHSVV